MTDLLLQCIPLVCLKAGPGAFKTIFIECFTGVTQQNRQRMACPVSSAAAQPQQQQISSGLRGLYPATTPHTSGYLQVSNLHKVYYEVHGNPQGIPAVVVHGGPGAGCYANHA